MAQNGRIPRGSSMPPLSRNPMPPPPPLRSRSSLIGSVRTMPTISEDGKTSPTAEAPSIPTGPERPEKRLSPLQIAYYRSSLHLKGLMAAEDFTQQRQDVDRRAGKRHISPLHDSPYATYPPLKALLDQQALDDDLPDRMTEKQRKGFRDSEWVAWRGGWCRILCLLLLLICLIVGLAVGLTLGLRKKDATNAPETTDITMFPSGSYSFTTALATVDTGCTSNKNTFTCYPYSTYASTSPDSSAATFFWIIKPLNSFQYTVSSSSNPFAPVFNNITMNLLDGNQFTERLNFQFTMPKGVVPNTQLTPGNDQTTTCYFNQTVMNATLWTRMRADYPSNITAVVAPTNASSTFTPWPYQVEIQQVQQAGANVPDCRTWQGQSLGDFSAGGSCGCYYSNHGLAGGNSTTQRRWSG